MKTWVGKDFEALGAMLTKGAQAASESLVKMTGVPNHPRITLPGALVEGAASFPEAGQEDCQAYYIFMPGGVFLALFPTDSPLVSN